jgi:5-methylcytosine-specific restriction endonuclease McrA
MLRWRAEHRGDIRAYANARHALLRDLHYRQQRARLKRASEGKRAKMREYQREWIREWRIANPERHREIKRRYRTKNRARELALRREWSRRPENQTKIKAGYQRWAKSELGRSYFKERDHKRRARKQLVYSLPCLSKIRELRREVRCYWCGGPMNPVSTDHVVPLARGGSHTPDNLVAACHRCNSSKRERLPQEWVILTIGQTSNRQ